MSALTPHPSPTKHTPSPTRPCLRVPPFLPGPDSAGGPPKP